MSAENLFKPITSRLDTIKEKPEPTAGPDYTMDEFDRTNSYDWEDFQPDAEPHHSHHHQHHHRKMKMKNFQHHPQHHHRKMKKMKDFQHHPHLRLKIQGFLKSLRVWENPVKWRTALRQLITKNKKIPTYKVQARTSLSKV